MLENKFMRFAIELAKLGEGWVSPNPMVGAVVVKNGKVISEGYHARCGEWHAERNALASCTESPEGATMYVTMEPCCHCGKTPPCTEIILEKKISRVVIGSRDPNPKVSGKGVQILRDCGIEVVENFMREECDNINPIFFHYITTNLPYVAIKYAMTLDGKIATHTGEAKWITGLAARNHVHQLRSKYSAIMVGIGTVQADDPMLTCRMEGGRNPLRIICDTQLRIPTGSQLCRTAQEIPTIVACGKLDNDLDRKRILLERLGLNILELPGEDGRVDLKKLLRFLGRNGIDSLLIEGGGNLNYSALECGIVQHVYTYIAPKLFGGSDARSPVEGPGVCLPEEAAVLKNLHITHLGDDILLEYEMSGGIHCVHRHY